VPFLNVLSRLEPADRSGGDLFNRPTPSGQIGEEKGARPGRKRGAETRSARLLHSYVGLKRGVCFPKALTDRVPKGCSEGFCHFWRADALVVLKFPHSGREHESCPFFRFFGDILHAPEGV
jgi:hypothetical protein